MKPVTKIRFRFIRNFTVEPVAMWLERELADSCVEATCEFGDFTGYVDDIESLAQRGEPSNIHVLALGLELAAEGFGRHDWPAQAVCERHRALVEAAIRNCTGTLVINTVLPPLFSETGLAAEPGRLPHAARIEALNSAIRGMAAASPGRVVLIDWCATARQLGEEGTYDYRFWHSSGAPFARPFLARYASQLAAVARATTGKARKCLLLDCDNTLWGGVLGEDGFEGIRMDPHSVPGAYFRAFQQSVIDLHRRGIAVALCSKNDEAAVLEVIDRHPHCLLRREHLATWRIDWNDKVHSIVDIGDELNLGLDSIVFVDDSAYECSLMRSALPQVRVVAVPDELSMLPHLLDRLAPFDGLTITTQDRERTRSYQQNRERTRLAADTGDLSRYKELLGTAIRVRKAGPLDLARIAQLFQRTNQFNLTTHRHDQHTLEQMLHDPDTLLVVGELSDRFGDLGLVAVAAAERSGDDTVVESFLMSCRALGRDAEVAFAAGLFRLCSETWHSARVCAAYIPTLRNAVAAGFWERTGLELAHTDPDGARSYEFRGDLAELSASRQPVHVTVEMSNG